MVRRTLGGLRAAAEQAGRIDIDRRETRLPLGDVPEEAAALVRAVNGALARLDEGYARHQRFLADAAHELRTPIAILNMRLEALPAGPERAACWRTRRACPAGGTIARRAGLERDSAPLLPLDLVELVRGVTAELAPLAVAPGTRSHSSRGQGR